MRHKVLITAALPYANGPLHFGHIAGAYLPADAYARYCRLQGCDVLFLCGSDEHGVAITLSAELAGRSPQEHVDIFHTVNKGLFDTLGMSFDFYSRTTWEGHRKPSYDFFLDLLHNGYIEEKTTEQLYSEKEGRFLADRYVVGTCPHCGFEKARGDECTACGASFEAQDLITPRSKLTNAPLVLRPTKHWFLRLDLLKEKLQHWLLQKAWKPNVLRFLEKYVADLRPRAITRDGTFGFDVPLEGAAGKVLYVWFDAPIGYISAAQHWAFSIGQKDRWKDYWLDPKTLYVQFIGKDNIPFHGAVFPAMCLGQNTAYKTVDELPANEFLTYEGRQFSKSDGHSIDLDAFFQKYSVDQIRYYLAATAPETADSDFSWKDFVQRINAELVGKIGNFVNRSLVLLQRHCEGKVPSAAFDEEAVHVFEKSLQTAFMAYESFSLRKAIAAIIELSQEANVYFDAKKPWELAKKGEKETLFIVLRTCLEAIGLLAKACFPIIPFGAQKMWNMAGFEGSVSLATQLNVGASLPPPSIIFAKIDPDREVKV